MARPRNVVIFHADQMRADALGCAGNPARCTPNIDALAADGTRFTRHIAGNPVCMPSRACFFTGLYCTGHGVWTNGVALPRRQYTRIDDQLEKWAGIRIVPEPPTMADVFSAGGYDMVCFGKLHFTPSLAPREYGYPESKAVWEAGANDAWNGPYYGFRHVELTQGHGEAPCALGHYAQWLRANHPDAALAVEEGRKTAHRPVAGLDDLYASAIPASLHNSAWIGQRACEYIKQQRPADRPFFLFCGFPDPHHAFTPAADTLKKLGDTPVQEPGDPDGRGLQGHPGVAAQRPDRVANFTPEQRACIYRYTNAMVHQIDCAIGEVMEALRSAGLEDNTLVVFTSDHGDFLCDHGLLRKWVFATDCLLRVPFILRCPGLDLPPVIDRPMSNVDVLPTLCGLTGVTPPAYLHGRDAVAAARAGQEYPVFAHASTGRPEMVNLTCYDGRYRYTVFPGGGFAELFDHREDPAETHNLAREGGHADTMRRLRDEIAQSMLNTWNPTHGCVSAW